MSPVTLDACPDWIPLPALSVEMRVMGMLALSLSELLGWCQGHMVPVTDFTVDWLQRRHHAASSAVLKVPTGRFGRAKVFTATVYKGREKHGIIRFVQGQATGSLGGGMGTRVVSTCDLRSPQGQ